MTHDTTHDTTYEHIAQEAVNRTIMPGAARGSGRHAALAAAREAIALVIEEAEAMVNSMVDRPAQPAPAAEPAADLRANAFVGAWERIELAQKLKVDLKGRAVEQLPELYWATMAEAAVLADLANADEDPGRDAGRYLFDRRRRIEESRARFDAAKRRRRPPPVSLWCRVLVLRGDWAGRYGQVTKMYPENVPPMLDVELDPPGRSDDPAEPITINVLYDDVTVGTPPETRRAFDGSTEVDHSGHGCSFDQTAGPQ